MRLFLREYMGLIILYLMNFIALLTIYFIFGGLNSVPNLIYFIFLSSFLLICYLIHRYYKNKLVYKNLDNKYNTFEEVLEEFGDSSLGRSMNKLCEELYGFYQQEVHIQLKKQEEHLSFINQWVHHMKTPLSVIKLYIQENDGEEMAENIKGEVDKLERGLKLALYNARLDNFEHDFNISNFSLKEAINEEVIFLKRLFIKNGVFPRVNVEDNITINSDRKWILFIMEQLITNSIKYSKNKGEYVDIRGFRDENNTIVEVEDKGIGISKKDIRRIFEAFYTGETGRKYGESTGMGLYLVKEVCDKLGHQIYVESKEDIGTKIKLVIKNV